MAILTRFTRFILLKIPAHVMHSLFSNFACIYLDLNRVLMINISVLKFFQNQMLQQSNIANVQSEDQNPITMKFLCNFFNSDPRGPRLLSMRATVYKSIVNPFKNREKISPNIKSSTLTVHSFKKVKGRGRPAKIAPKKSKLSRN